MRLWKVGVVGGVVFTGLVAAAPRRSTSVPARVEPAAAAAASQQEEIPLPSQQKDENGQTDPPRDDPSAGDPVTLFTGNFEVQETDLRIAGRGLDFEFTRTYRNGTSYSSALGAKWDFNWNQKIVLEFDFGWIPPYPGPGAGARSPNDPLGGSDDDGDDGGGFTQAVIGGGEEPPIVPVVGAFYFDGALRIDKFTPINSTDWQSPPGYFAKLKGYGAGYHLSQNPPDYFELRSSNGTIHRFEAVTEKDPYHRGLVYRLVQVTDRAGNFIRITYRYHAAQKWNSIDQVFDTYDRPITFTYDPSGQDLLSIADFEGRTVVFTRNGIRNLTHVRSPSVTPPLGTPFISYLQGKTVNYVYGNPQPPTQHELVSIVDPQEYRNGAGPGTPYLTNTYSIGRVVKQVFGGVGGTSSTPVPAGGTYLFLAADYTPPADRGWFHERRRVLRVDPNGNAQLTHFDSDGFDRLTYQFTGRLDPETLSPTTNPNSLVSVNPASPDSNVDRLLGSVAQIRLTDPKSYITKKTFNSDGLLIEQEAPGTHVTYTYDSTADVFQRANLLQVDQIPVVQDGSPTIKRGFLYEPYYNQLRARFDPRGFVEGDLDAFRTTVLFDYQEADITSLTTQGLMASHWGIDQDQPTALAVFQNQGSAIQSIRSSDNLGDINGDPVIQDKGNAIQVRMPTAEVFEDAVLGTTINQQAWLTTTYNGFSLPETSKDPRGNITAYEYWAANDPDGDTEETTGLSNVIGSDGGGKLKRCLLPEGVTQEFEYDDLRRPTQVKNGRGFSWEALYNELDHLIYTKEPRANDPLGYEVWVLHDWNDSQIEVRQKNLRPAFDAQGYPTGGEVTDPILVKRFEYDLLNQMVLADLPGNATSRRISRFRYDKLGNHVLTLLPEWQNNASEVVARVYDERNLTFTETRAGLTALFLDLQAHADIPELLLVQDAPEETTAELAYTPAGNPSVNKDGEGNPYTRLYDGLERLKEYRDPLQNYATFAWDVAGQLRHQRAFDSADNLLSHTRHQYDELGRVFQTDRAFFAIGATIATPDGPLTPGDGLVTTRYVFDAASNTTQVVDDNASWTSFLYDGLNRAYQQQDKVGNFTLNYYDKASNLIRTEEWEKQPDGAFAGPFTSWFVYDELNRQLATADNAGRTTRQLYDSRGNLTYASDAKAAGALIPMVTLDPLGERTDLNGPAVNAPGNTTHLLYDDASRLVATIQHMRMGGQGGNAINQALFGDGELNQERQYDRNDRLIAQLDDLGNPTSYFYDPVGRRRQITYADLTFETWTFDRNGDPATHVDANGTIAGFTFDDARRLTTKTISFSSPVMGTTLETYVYDGLGRMTTGADNDSSLSFIYDSLGRVIRENQDGLLVTGIYDGVGALRALAYPGGRTLALEVDNLNRLQQVADLGSPTPLASFAYVGPVRLDSRQFPINGTTLRVGYDNARNVTSTRHELSGQAFSHFSYVWDRADNKTDRQDLITGVSHAYTYDSSYQLRKSDHLVNGIPSSFLYGVDGAANRTTVLGGYYPGTYSRLGNDLPVNQYTATPLESAGNDRQYDNNGNLTLLKGTHSVRYDYKNQMVEYATATTSSYQYDVLGRRTRKTLPSGEQTRFIYWGTRCIEERDGSDLVRATFVHGRAKDEILSMRRDGVDSYYHSDDLGNILKLTNSAGQVVESYDYDDYGLVLDPNNNFAPHTGSSRGNPYFFQGHRLDSETGLYYCMTRYLEPATGRFTVRDPLGMWGDASCFGNGYAFTGNNPWSFTDSTGMSKEPGCTYPNFDDTVWPWPIVDAVNHDYIDDDASPVRICQAPIDSERSKRQLAWKVKVLLEVALDNIKGDVDAIANDPTSCDAAWDMDIKVTRSGDLRVTWTDLETNQKYGIMVDPTSEGDMANLKEVLRRVDGHNKGIIFSSKNLQETLGIGIAVSIGEGLKTFSKFLGRLIGRRIAPTLEITDRQFGRKAGEHMRDWGLNPSNAQDRAMFRKIIEQIAESPDRVVSGPFRNQGSVDFMIRGGDVVVSKAGKFITVLKNGINNPSVQRALGRQ